MSGTKLFKALNDYTVFDLETCGLYGYERTKIVEISALRYRNDTLTDTFTTLVNPEMHIPDQTTRKNNITDDMVASAPVIADVLPDFLDFIGDDILIGHNIGSFDNPIISELALNLLDRKITNDYVDTYSLAKRCLPELQNHRLETLAEHLGFSIEGMHRAEKDCIITQQLYMALKPLCGKQISPSFYSPKPRTKSQYSYAQVEPDHADNNPFLGKTCIVYGAFQQLSTEQIKNIFAVIGAVYVDYFCYSADMLILGDDMYKKYLSQAEDDTINSFIKLNKPIMSEYDFVRYSHTAFSSTGNSSNFSTKIDVAGKTICLTGNFDIDQNRDRIVNRLVELGAIVKNGVIKSLDYLIVGNQGSADYKSGNKGSKEEKAEHYNESGANIQIVTESEFFTETEVLENV